MKTTSTKRFLDLKTNKEILEIIRVSQEKMLSSMPGSTSEFVHGQMYDMAMQVANNRSLEL